MAKGEAAPKRLSKEGRRTQLLEIASELIVEHGVTALTMERLAAEAGVSKALPYVHFENAQAVLVELYRLEVVHIGERVTSAIDADDPGEHNPAAAVRAYFSVVAERGAVLGTLTGAGIPRLVDRGRRRGNRFFAAILETNLGLDKRAALLAAGVLLGAMNGALDAWANRECRRDEAEQQVIDALAGIAAGHRQRSG